MFRWAPATPLYDPRTPFALARGIASHRIQVVHSHLSTANIASRAAAVSLLRPHMTTVHTIPGPTAEDSRSRALVDGWSAWLSRRLVAPSPEIADAYMRAFHLPKARMRVIPNAPAASAPGRGFDREAVRRELIGPDGTHLVVAVARLQPEKGIDDLVGAASLLRDRLPGLRIVVAGSGPEEAFLQDRIASEGLAGTFELLGTRSDVGALLAAADAFCLPSRHEGLPISLLEAMDAGLPCVATRVGGIPGLVTDGVDGVLVEPSDRTALASALEDVLGDPLLAARLGSRGRRLVGERYGLATVAGAYADLYDELAGKRGG